MLSAGASPSTSSPTGNYAVSKITIAQVYVLLSTLKAKKDDPAEYENKVNRLNKVRNCHPELSSLVSPRRPTPTMIDCLFLHLHIGVVFFHHFLSARCKKCLLLPLVALLILVSFLDLIAAGSPSISRTY